MVVIGEQTTGQCVSLAPNGLNSGKSGASSCIMPKLRLTAAATAKPATMARNRKLPPVLTAQYVASPGNMASTVRKVADGSSDNGRQCATPKTRWSMAIARPRPGSRPQTSGGSGINWTITRPKAAMTNQSPGNGADILLWDDAAARTSRPTARSSATNRGIGAVQLPPPSITIAATGTIHATNCARILPGRWRRLSLFACTWRSGK